MFVNWIEDSKYNQIYKLFENESKDKDDNIDNVIKYSETFLKSINNLDDLFEIYKESDEYQDSCDDDDEKLLKNPANPQFKCNLYWIYDEFLSKISNNKKAYTFIKEEYLKEKVQYQPFASYYNKGLLSECKTSVCSKRAESKVASYVPLTYSKSPFYTKWYKFIRYKWDVWITIDSYEKYKQIFNEDKITDYKYYFDLNNAFSFEEENYIEKENLHKVALNPNLYLHAFIRWIKDKSEKYQINVYWDWFNWVIYDENKKEFDKEVVTSIWNYLSHDVVTKKVITDLKLINNSENDVYWFYRNWVRISWDDDKIYKYNIIPWIEAYSQFWTNTTFSQNLINYINNIKLWDMLKNNISDFKNLNKDDISNYDLLLSRSLENNLGFTPEQKIVFDKFFYSIYLSNLLETYYNNKNINLNKQLSSEIFNYEDLYKNLSTDDYIAKIYKDVILYNLWYIDEDRASTIFSSIFIEKDNS